MAAHCRVVVVVVGGGGAHREEGEGVYPVRESTGTPSNAGVHLATCWWCR